MLSTTILSIIVSLLPFFLLHIPKFSIIYKCVFAPLEVLLLVRSCCFYTVRYMYSVWMAVMLLWYTLHSSCPYSFVIFTSQSAFPLPTASTTSTVGPFTLASKNCGFSKFANLRWKLLSNFLKTTKKPRQKNPPPEWVFLKLRVKLRELSECKWYA